MIPFALALLVLIGVPLPADVVDGDTIRLGGGERLRFSGMDAPERRQRCTDARGSGYPAGILAADDLRALIHTQAVTCASEKRDRYDRPLVVCTTPDNKASLNERMVRDGWAIAAYGHQYDDAEMEARRARRGIWAGSCEKPSDWRKGRR